MTNRERMLIAYKRQMPDQVPVSLELWYDMGVTIARGRIFVLENIRSGKRS